MATSAFSRMLSYCSGVSRTVIRFTFTVNYNRIGKYQDDEEIANEENDEWEKEVDISLKRITSLIEPVMIVVVGILAGTVVISIFLPMFSMVDNMGV